MKFFHFALAACAIVIFYVLQRYNSTCCTSVLNVTYTHIIVGAGSSGCVLAALLSENVNNSVLLVEAGGHFNMFSRIPLLATLLQRSAYDWQYKTEPQKYSSRGFYDSIQYIPRGKGLGGTGQINFMIQGFLSTDSFEPLVDYGLSELKNKLTLFYNDRYMHQRCTRYKTHTQMLDSKLSDAFKAAILELNVSKMIYRPSTSTIYKGERWSTFHSHLLPSVSRHNLHILCNTEVTKLIFDKQIATGIEVVNENIRTNIYSEAEIVLAAGAINTPKLLLLSGIGNKSDLECLNISVVADVPGVGLNLYDHMNVPLYASIEESISCTMRKLLGLREIFNYIFYRTVEGLWSVTPAEGNANLPFEVNLLLFGLGSTDESQFRAIANYIPEIFSSSFPLHNNISQEGLVFLATCLAPKSRGFLKLRAADAFSKPLIDPEYLKEHEDVQCLKKGMKLIEQITNTKPFMKIGAHIYYPDFSNCAEYDVGVDNEHYLECVIRTVAITAYHFGGTCKMGRENDSLAVVDQNFRVRRIAGLRVVDASILPAPLSDFPTSIVVLLAEYASSLMNAEVLADVA